MGAVNGTFHPEFPAWPWPICTPMDVYHGRASSGSGVGGGERWPFSLSLCLVCNWSGAHPSPGIRSWRSSWKGHMGRAGVHCGSRDRAGLASGAEWETELRAIKPFLPTCSFPCPPSVSSDSQGTCPRQGISLFPELYSSWLVSGNGLWQDRVMLCSFTARYQEAHDSELSHVRWCSVGLFDYSGVIKTVYFEVTLFLF